MKHQECITNDINKILQKTSKYGCNYIYKKCDESKYDDADQDTRQDMYIRQFTVFHASFPQHQYTGDDLFRHVQSLNFLQKVPNIHIVCYTAFVKVWRS